MTVFLIILVFAVILQSAAKAGFNRQMNFKDNARIATGIAFILTGVSHFVIPEKFMEMMPPMLPAPVFLIYLSGVLEILGGIGLMISMTKYWAAIGLILLLLAVFPANIYVALNNVPLGGLMSYAIYQWLRLPMQIVLIGWVWWGGGNLQIMEKNNES